MKRSRAQMLEGAGGDGGDVAANQVRRLSEPWEDFPQELLIGIFKRLRGSQIAANCSIVCKSWRDAAAEPHLWEALTEGTGLRSGDETRLEGGWKSLFAAVYAPNLVASPNFETMDQADVDFMKKHARERPWQPKHRVLLNRIHTEGDDCEGYHTYTHWNVEGGNQFHRGGGDGITREQPPVECPACPAAPQAAVIATSYQWGLVQQYIGFHSYSNKFLDESPPLAFTVWYAGRYHVEGSFRMSILFRDELKNVTTTWDSGVIPAEPGEWKQAKFLIHGYPKGLRSLILKLAAKSREHLRGSKGPKFTAVKLHFVPISELGFYKDFSAGSLMAPPPS